VSSPEEEGEEGEVGNFADVGEEPAEESELIELWDTDWRSEGEVYESIFVVEINSTGAEI
jgi:hypothetical protein